MQIRILYNLLVWIFKTCFMILIHLSVRDLKADLTSNVLCLRKEKKSLSQDGRKFSVHIRLYTWIGNECGMLVVCSYLFPFCPWPSSACLLLFLWQKKCCWLWNGNKKVKTTDISTTSIETIPLYENHLIEYQNTDSFWMSLPEWIMVTNLHKGIYLYIKTMP